jgi:hypothetical protein
MYSHPIELRAKGQSRFGYCYSPFCWVAVFIAQRILPVARSRSNKIWSFHDTLTGCTIVNPLTARITSSLQGVRHGYVPGFGSNILTSLAEILGLPPRLSGSGVGVRLYSSGNVRYRHSISLLLATTSHLHLVCFSVGALSTEDWQRMQMVAVTATAETSLALMAF